MNGDTDFNLVELVNLLREINENSEEAKENEFVVYDKDGNKILL